jgi:ubiquinone/menaquinone biosynthesis C-methylase UbiE
MNYISSQFGNPRGILGRFFGFLMAQTNQAKDDWTIEMLDVQPDDRILEIGFGSGAAIQKISQIAEYGFIAGIDHSQVMLQQASNRNQQAIHQGLVELKHGEVASLPYKDETFDEAMSSNSHFFWDNPVESLKEVRRVLKPGGLIVLTWQPRWAKTEAMLTESAQNTAAQLKAAGFTDIQLKFKSMKAVDCICLRGIK